VVRRHLEAASVGARLVAARAAGEDMRVDTLNPVVERVTPEPRAHDVYRDVRRLADARVDSLLARAPRRTVATRRTQEDPT
jgi:hypothetical protein